MASWVDDEIEYRNAGFSDDQINEEKSKRYKEYVDGGIDPSAIEDYFNPAPPKDKLVNSYVQQNMGVHFNPEFSNAERPAESGMEALKSGMQMGGVNLLMYGPPNVVVADKAPVTQRLLHSVGVLTADAPLIAAGAITGAAAGAKGGAMIGAMAGPVGATVGAAVGGLAGGLYGAGFVPEYFRQYLVDSYKNGAFKTPSDFFERSLTHVQNANTAGAVSMAAGAVGGTVAARLGSRVVPSVAKTAAQVAAESGTMIGTTAMIEGRLPERNDFLDVPLLLGTVHGAHVITGNAHKFFVKTGKDPIELAQEAKTNPDTMQKLIVPEDQMTFDMMLIGNDKNQTSMELSDRVANPPFPTDQMSMELMSKEITEQEAFDFATDKKKAPSPARLYLQELSKSMDPESHAALDGIDSEINRLKTEKENPVPSNIGAGEYDAYLKALETLSHPETTKEDFYAASDIEREFKSKYSEKDVSLVLRSEEQSAKIDKRIENLNLRRKGLQIKIANSYKQAAEYSKSFLKPKVEVLDVTPEENLNLFDKDYIADELRDRVVIVPEEMRQQSFGLDIPSEVDSAIKGLPETSIQEELPLTMDDFKNGPEGQQDFGFGGRHPPENPTGPLPPGEKGRLIKDMVVRRLNRAKELPGKERLFSKIFQGFSPLNDAAVKIYGDKNLPAADRNAFIMAKLSKNWGNLAAYWMKYNPTDFAGKDLKVKSYEDIIRPFAPDTKLVVGREVNKGRLAEFENFRVAKRVLEKAKQGVPTGANFEDAYKTVKEGEKEFGKAHREMQDFHDAALDYLAESGAITKEFVARLKQNNEQYVLFKRVIDGESTFGLPTRNPLNKRMIGSDRQIYSTYASEARRLKSIIRIGERQRVLNVLQDTLIKDDSLGEFFELVGEKRTETSVEDMSKLLDSEEIAVSKDENPTSKDVSDKSYKQSLIDKDGTLTINRDGVEYKYRVKEDIAEAIKQLDSPQELSTWIRGLSKMTKLVRSGIINSPLYPMKNAIKDLPSAMVFGEKYNPITDGVSAWIDVFTENANFKEYVKQKAASGTFIDAADFFTNDGEFLYEQSTLRRGWNTVRTPFDLFKRVNGAFEHAPRMSDFKKKGGGAAGAFGALDKTVNFSQSGSSKSLKELSAIVPFLSSALSGTEKGYRELISSKTENKAATWMKVGKYVVAPAVLASAYRWMQEDNIMYENASQFDKDTKIGIPINRWKPATPDDAQVPKEYRRMRDGVEEVNHGYMMWIPKNQELGVVQTAVERLIDGFMAENPSQRSNFAEYLFNNFVPSVAPPVVMGAIELGINRNIHTNSPIVPDWMLKGNSMVLPSERYTDQTSAFAKSFSQGLSHVPLAGEYIGKLDAIAPANIDFLLNKYTGGMYNIVSSGADLALKSEAVTGIPRSFSDWFFNNRDVKYFVKRYPYDFPSDLKLIEEETAHSTQVQNTIKMYEKKGDFNTALEIEKRNGELLDKMTGIAMASSRIHKEIEGIRRDTDRNYSGAQRQQDISGMLFELSLMARDGVKDIQENKQYLKQLESDTLKRGARP